MNTNKTTTIAFFTLIAFFHLTRPLSAATTVTPKLSPIQSATPEASPSPTPEKLKQIEDLKERLATRVAQLRQTQRRAISGTIKSISISTLTIEAPTKDLKLELADDIVVIQYLKNKRTKLTTAALDKGDVVAVFGNYDVTLDILTPKVIHIQTPIAASRKTGIVTDIDKADFSFVLQTPEAQTVTVDFEKNTTTQKYSPGNGLEKSGFSKIAIGDTVHISAVSKTKKIDRVSAVNIADLGNLTGAAASPGPTVKPTQKITPTPKE